MKYELKNSRMQVIADTLGAELVGVTVDGRERLWQNPTGEWAGHAPVLFPVCGNCRITEQGVTYPLLKHGFAKRSEFRLYAQSADTLTFLLCSSAETKQFYPYEFSFFVTYRICENKLEIIYEIENVGQKPLYASCGGHESFALDGNVGEYLLEFEQEETFSALLHDRDGRLTGETKSFGNGKMLPLPAEFLREGRTLIFRVRSRSVMLRNVSAAAVARIAFDGFPYLLLWRPLTAPMICIEPWHNLPDGIADTEFSKKEGVFCVEPQKKTRFSRSVEYF